MLTPQQLQDCATTLDDALQAAREIERLTVAHPKLTLEEGYRIQDEGIQRRLKRGEHLRGFKLGFTSRAKREQMGLHDPIYGVLTHEMEARGRFSLAHSIHPKIEPEIAFITAKDLRGRPGAEEILDACSGVLVAMEILDSRFLNFKYFSLPDVVADNCSSARYVLGDTIHPAKQFALDDLEMVMEINGKPVQSARSSAISGTPIRSLVQLCEMLDARGLYLPKNSLVLAGAATQAVQLEPGMDV
ncbi:MAG: 2-keto-4-pentenoate hydratase, partial [Bdellovibrionota bacterium]